MKYVYMHDCGQPAFLWFGEPPHSGDIVRADMARHIDGTPITPMTAAACDSCGARFSFRSDRLVEAKSAPSA